MWEDALKLCKQLVNHYEAVRFDFTRLSELLNRMAVFYKNIMNPQNLRPEPEYFRVAYYGRGFPAFLQNKVCGGVVLQGGEAGISDRVGEAAQVFVYRGNGFERLAEFTTRILDQFPNAEPMKKLTPPSEESKESPHQYLQISKVDCMVDEDSLFPCGGVSEQIRGYYRANHISTFSYARPFHRGTRVPNNEFATLCIEKTTLEVTYSLPGILRWFPVCRSTSVEISPLENAMETMAQTNSDLLGLVLKYEKDSALPLHPFTSKLSGIVDAAVMGGIANYEQAFLCEAYEESHPDDEEKLKALKDLIIAQVPLLEAGLLVHGCRVRGEVQKLHTHLVTTFQRMKTQVQEKYGEVDMPEELRVLVHPQRLQAMSGPGGEGGTMGGTTRTSQHYSNPTHEYPFINPERKYEQLGGLAADLPWPGFEPGPADCSLCMEDASHNTTLAGLGTSTATAASTPSASPRNSFTRGLFSYSTLPHKSLFMHSHSMVEF
ncbi:Dedicator of cytokinesis protein 5 [Chionoecetes opilio]|uniref:Dedicator of cytokinesis protein 5 n=1 Tax=Chionoecetes opilio TaxID=41210 RepID=A0A8J4YCQ3_CHIOP|nr:Dedicator of cytokinesis protein 5 [Chionoecetes opilio]